MRKQEFLDMLKAKLSRLPSAVFSTAPRSERAMISIALMWNISESSHAPRVM